jgi:hypothetical protein
MAEDVRDSLEMMKHHCGEPAFQKIAGAALDEITRLRSQIAREKLWNEERRTFAGQLCGVVESLDNAAVKDEIVSALKEVADRQEGGCCDGGCRTDGQ